MRWIVLAIGGIGAFLAVAAPTKAAVEAGVKFYQAGDYNSAIAEWLPHAAQNDPAALFNLGQVYRLGRGVKADQAVAAQYYERSARYGHVSAMTNLAGIYYFSKGDLQDRKAAVMWWETAARAGDARARYMLGILYFNGEQVARDWPRAFALTQIAADEGIQEARSSLVDMRKHLTAEDISASDRLRQQMAPGVPMAEVELTLASASRPNRSGVSLPAVSPAAAPMPPSRPKLLTTMPSGTRTLWRVQLGAYGATDGAQRAWDEARRAHGPIVASLSPAYVPAGAVTKLQVGGFDERALAGAVCDRLKASGQTCFVVAAASN
jgi:uncharacterized protein